MLESSGEEVLLPTKSVDLSKESPLHAFIIDHILSIPFSPINKERFKKLELGHLGGLEPPTAAATLPTELQTPLNSNFPVRICGDGKGLEPPCLSATASH